MSLSDPPQKQQPEAMEVLDSKEDATTSWKADLQQIIEDLEANHISRVLKIQNKRPTPYERKMAAKKGTTTVANITAFSNLIVGNFPIASDFDNPWIFANSFDQMLVKYKTIGLSMENKQLIVKEIDQIRGEFVKKFDIFMKKLGYCCGAVWGGKYVDRWCSCNDQSPIIFVERKIDEVFAKVFCENCVKENREACRETHRHDYAEMERFQCIKCQKELHRQCAESFTANCCKQCDPNPFRYPSTSTTTTTTTTSSESSSSPSPSKIDITNSLLKENNCYTKLLAQKKCPFSKPELLKDAIEYVKVLRHDQKLGTDNAMNEYLTPSNYNLQLYGLFHAHDEGDLLLAMAFVEEYDGRCLIEILALQTSTPNLKNALKKEIIASFFVELVNIQRNLVKAVHLRVPSGLQGLSAEIFADLSLKLPKENIAVKTLKQILTGTVSFFEIPCFSNDPKFYEIIHVIHELGFKINDKPPKLRSYLSLEAATKNYIGQLTNEIVVNGNSTKIITSKNDNEVGTEEKPLSILSITDLLQAMEEMHLKFTDIQSCCYSTFKILSFFRDPRLEALPKAKSVDSGYSSLSSPSSSTVSMNYGFSAAASADEKEVKHVEKKFCPSSISSLSSSTPAAKKRKLESPCLTVSKIVNSMYSACFNEEDRNQSTIAKIPSTLSTNLDSYGDSIDTTSLSDEEVEEAIPPCPMVSWDISSTHVKQEENEYCNFCINLPPAIDSISSTIILRIFSICDGQKEESSSINPSIITSSPPFPNENNFEEIFLSDEESPIDLSVSNDINQEEDKIGIPDSSISSSPKFDEHDDSKIRCPSPTVLPPTDPTSSTFEESERLIRSSTPGPDILNLLPSIKSSLPILTPDEEKEREANQKPLPKEHAQLCDIALRYLELEKAQNDLIKNCVSSKLERNSALNILTSFYNNNYSN